MANIYAWKDLADLAPRGAVTFRYRKMTGQRKKFYEGGKYFDLAQDAEDPSMEWPDAVSGKWAVEFYDSDGKPCLLDGSTAEDPVTLQPIQFAGGSAIHERDPAGFQKISFDRMMGTIEALAKTAVGANAVYERHIEKITKDLGDVSEKLEKAQPGVIGQLALKHSNDFGKVLEGLKEITIQGVKWLRKENGGSLDEKILIVIDKLASRVEEIGAAQKRMQKTLPAKKPARSPAKKKD